VVKQSGQTNDWSQSVLRSCLWMIVAYTFLYYYN